MNVSPEEARDSLAAVGAVTQATWEAASYRGSDWLFIIWGLVWLLGYVGTPFLGPLAIPCFGIRISVSLLWWVALLALGGMASGLAYRSTTPVRWASSGRNVGWLWLVLWGYVYLWLFLLSPFVQVQGHGGWMALWKHFGVLMGTVPMCGYLIMGLWLQVPLLLALGLAITALLLLGLLLPWLYFWFWCGIVAGGTLLVTGLILRSKGARHGRH